VFILVKQVNRFHEKEAPPPVTPPQEALLAEIRDLLKSRA
jgi:large-conductance mechanosensitive channel